MDYRPIGREGPRYSFRGAVEPNVCQWASTVVSRHRVGGPRSLAKALPYATGTAMCTIYPFSLSLSLSLSVSRSVSLSPPLFVIAPRLSNSSKFPRQPPSPLTKLSLKPARARPISLVPTFLFTCRTCHVCVARGKSKNNTRIIE